MKVLIIGAGLAGLSAAHDLSKLGIEVLILESNTRIGGRVAKAPEFSIPIDVGASWIHRVDGNPLAEIASRLKLKTDISANPNLTGESSFELFDSDGSRFDKNVEQKVRDQFDLLVSHGVKLVKNLKTDVSVEKMLNLAEKSLFEKQPRVMTPQEVRFEQWLKSGIEGWENTSLKNLSSRQHFEEEVKDQFQGADAFVVDGFFHIVQELAKDLLAQNKIAFGQVVEKILYDDNQVFVKTRKGDVFSADYCINTVPLGVLKSGTISFYPPLPKAKQSAIHNMGFGVMNKIILEFPECFWNPTCDGIGFVSETDHGEFNFFVNLFPVLKRPILMGFVAADFGRKMESWEDAKIIRKVMKILNTIYSNNNNNINNNLNNLNNNNNNNALPSSLMTSQEAARKSGVPFVNKLPWPSAFRITRWGSNPHSKGSYSFMSTHCSGQEIQDLAENNTGRLLWAGEATWMYPGYTHGAFLSGKREANRIWKEVVMMGREKSQQQQQQKVLQLNAPSPISSISSSFVNGRKKEENVITVMAAVPASSFYSEPKKNSDQKAKSQLEFAPAGSSYLNSVKIAPLSMKLAAKL